MSLLEGIAYDFDEYLHTLLMQTQPIINRGIH